MKDLLRFGFDGDEFQCTMWLEEGNRTKLLTTLAKWIHKGPKERGIPYASLNRRY